MEKAPDIIIEHEADMIEKLEKVDYTERLLYGVYLVKEEDGVYLLDNGIKSKKPLMIVNCTLKSARIKKPDRKELNFLPVF